jgi:hypothetical protein
MISIATKLNRAAVLAGLLGLGAAGFNAPVLSDSDTAGNAAATGSESAPSGETPPPALQELKAKREEISALTQQVRQIQRNAAKANPELMAEQENYRDLVVSAMETDNYDPEAAVDQIRALQSELQSSGGDLSSEQRRAKTQELQKRKQAFRKKQQAAMQDEDVRTARRELGKKMEAAMKEQNPEAEQIIARLETLQSEYRALLQKVIKQQQGGSAPEGDQG